jgi:hypothetical protein
MNGKCKLCLRDGVLQLSHLEPAGVYRILRDETEKNPNPWLLTKTAAVQTSRQTRAWLLCRDCEQRFSKNGENWVLAHCLKADRSFPLASILASRKPDLSSAETTTKVHYTSQILEINIPALSYFAASMFWRASVHPWNRDGSFSVRLGPFEELFRKYLMGLADFPKPCSLWVAVREGGKIDRLTYAPIGERRGNYHVHKFPMPGLGFSLTVSKNLPTGYRNMCFVHGNGNPIIVTGVLEEGLLQDAVRIRQNSFSQPRESGTKQAKPPEHATA